MRHQFHSAFPLAAFLALFLFFSSCGEKADSTGDSTGFTPERVAALPDGGCLLVTSVPKADPPQQSLVRMDAQGKRLWETNIPGDIGGSDHHESPIVAGGGKAIIRVGGLKADAGAEQKIIAYDLESGEKRWERPAASMFRSMVVRGEHLVVVPVFLSKNALEVLQLSDGNVAWTYQLPEKYGRDEVRVLEKHVSYFGEGTDTLMLFDLTNGKMVFSTHGLSPTYDGNRLFYGTSSGIVAVDLLDLHARTLMEDADFSNDGEVKDAFVYSGCTHVYFSDLLPKYFVGFQRYCLGDTVLSVEWSNLNIEASRFFSQDMTDRVQSYALTGVVPRYNLLLVDNRCKGRVCPPLEGLENADVNGKALAMMDAESMKLSWLGQTQPEIREFFMLFREGNSHYLFTDQWMARFDGTTGQLAAAVKHNAGRLHRTMPNNFGDKSIWLATGRALFAVDAMSLEPVYAGHDSVQVTAAPSEFSKHYGVK